MKNLNQLRDELATKWGMERDVTFDTDIRDLFKEGFDAGANLIFDRIVDFIKNGEAQKYIALRSGFSVSWPDYLVANRERILNGDGE